MSTSYIAFLVLTIILSINTFCFTIIIVFVRISCSTIFIFLPSRPSMFYSMCKCAYTSKIYVFYNADSVRYTIQPLSFHSIFCPTNLIFVLLELHASIILYFRDIRYIKARKMRLLRRRLRLVLVTRILIALFFFLI
jgi:hypothetical protein